MGRSYISLFPLITYLFLSALSLQSASSLSEHTFRCAGAAGCQGLESGRQKKSAAGRRKCPPRRSTSQMTISATQPQMWRCISERAANCLFSHFVPLHCSHIHTHWLWNQRTKLFKLWFWTTRKKMLKLDGVGLAWISVPRLNFCSCWMADAVLLIMSNRLCRDVFILLCHTHHRAILWDGFRKWWFLQRILWFPGLQCYVYMCY